MPKNVRVYESWGKEFPNLSFPKVIFIKKKAIAFLSPCIYSSLKYLLKKFLLVFHFLTCSHFEYLLLPLSALFSHAHPAVGRISTGPANTANDTRELCPMHFGGRGMRTGDCKYNTENGSWCPGYCGPCSCSDVSEWRGLPPP